MRVWDVKVLCVSVWLFVVLLRLAPGRVVFVETWTLRAAAGWDGDEAVATNLWLPTPLFTDLNGDGHAEVVAVTHLPHPRLVVANADPRVTKRQLKSWGDPPKSEGRRTQQAQGSDSAVRRMYVDPRGAASSSSSSSFLAAGDFLYGRGFRNRFKAAFVIGERDLVKRPAGRSADPEGDKVAARKKRPLALAVGSGGSSATQVLALVTADWTVLVLDSTLRLIWESGAIREALAQELGGGDVGIPVQLAVHVMEGGDVAVVGSVEGEARPRVWRLEANAGALAWAFSSPRGEDASTSAPLASCLGPFKGEVMRGGLPHRWASSDDTRLGAISLTTSMGDAGDGDDDVSALVAHVREGLVVVRADTGVGVCEMALPDSRGATTLHADIDGDGVVNHVSALDGARAEELKETLRGVVPGMALMQPCYVVNTAGTDTTVSNKYMWSTAGGCRPVPGISGRSTSSQSQRRRAREAMALLSLEFATPALLRDAPRLNNAWGVDETRAETPSRGDVVTLNNRGDVARLSGQSGFAQWITRTRAGWSAGHSMLPGVKLPGGNRLSVSAPPQQAGTKKNEVVVQHPVYPSVEPFALKSHAHPDHVLVVGERNGLVLGPRGGEVGTFLLPAPPTSRVSIEDLDGDGLTDVLVHTHGAYFAFRQELRWGVVAWLGVIGLVLAVFYVLHEQAGLKPGEHDVDVLKAVKDLLAPVEALSLDVGQRSRDGVVRASSTLFDHIALRSRRSREREVLPRTLLGPV